MVSSKSQHARRSPERPSHSLSTPKTKPNRLLTPNSTPHLPRGTADTRASGYESPAPDPPAARRSSAPSRTSAPIPPNRQPRRRPYGARLPALGRRPKPSCGQLEWGTTPGGGSSRRHCPGTSCRGGCEWARQKAKATATLRG